MKVRSMIWVAVLVGAPLFAQTQYSSSVAPNGVAHIALQVSDLDAEVSFFAKLGFQKAFTDVGSNGRTQQIIIKVNDEEFIQLYPHSDPKQPLGFMHVCYEAQDVKGLNARYVSAGLKPGPVQQDGAGDLWFNMLDPEGRTTEFMQYLVNSRQASDAGKHLGRDRISDELLGFELPVKNMEAAQKFYEALGFEAKAEGTSVRLGLPGNPELHIVLQPARANSYPQFLFPIDDASMTAEELQKAGLQAQRSNKLVFVRDGDGNSFVLLETGDHSPRHARK